ATELTTSTLLSPAQITISVSGGAKKANSTIRSEEDLDGFTEEPFMPPCGNFNMPLFRTSVATGGNTTAG
ncbi:unnamed protein product, partial [Amoebophrya sp. A25]